MERQAQRGVEWVHLPVIATLARLLCRELTLQNYRVSWIMVSHHNSRDSVGLQETAQPG